MLIVAELFTFSPQERDGIREPLDRWREGAAL